MKKGKMDMDFEFTFQNVGQGLFYTGWIGTDINNSFKFVYDCGSTNRTHCKNAVDKYKKDIANKIDLLVISHFHDDHINGLDELLNGVDV